MQIIYELSGKSALDFSARIGYNDTAPIWTGIEVVITALTRNQVVSQEARGFESHPVRQKGTTARVAVVLFCIPRGGFERERCKKTCRRHVFPATRPPPQRRSNPTLSAKKERPPMWRSFFFAYQEGDSNGSGVRKRAGGTFSPRPGLRRSGGRIPPCPP